MSYYNILNCIMLYYLKLQYVIPYYILFYSILLCPIVFLFFFEAFSILSPFYSIMFYSVRLYHSYFRDFVRNLPNFLFAVRPPKSWQGQL